MNNADAGLPPRGTTLQRAFEALVSTLERRGIRYAIIGGIALIQYARTRTTDDIDALMIVPQLALPALFEDLSAMGFQVDLFKSIRDFRDGGLTSISYEGIVVDLMRPMLPLYNHVLDHAVTAQVFQKEVKISTVEGLIVMKLIAMRPQDEMDIRDLLNAYLGKVDLGFIRSELDTLMESQDSRRVKLESWIQEAIEH